MKKAYLIISILFLVGCGGGSDNGPAPDFTATNVPNLEGTYTLTGASPSCVFPTNLNIDQSGNVLSINDPISGLIWDGTVSESGQLTIDGTGTLGQKFDCTGQAVNRSISINCAIEGNTCQVGYRR